MNQHYIPVDDVWVQIILKLLHSTALALAVFGCIWLIHRFREKFGGTTGHGALSGESTTRVKADSPEKSRAAGYLILPEDLAKGSRTDSAVRAIQFVEKWVSTLSFFFYLAFKTVVNIKKWTL